MSGDPKDLRADEAGRKSWLEDIGPEGMSDAEKISQLDTDPRNLGRVFP